MVIEILNDFFCKPILNYEGYNLVNTLVYGVILLVIAFKIVYPFFNKRNIRFDHRFLISLLPFILLGSSFRIFEDLKLIPRSCNPLEPAFYTISPGVYIFIGILTILSLWLSLEISKKTKYSALTVFTAIGSVFALISLVFLAPFITEWIAVIAIPVFTLLLVIGATILTRMHSKTKTLLDHNPQNQLVLFGQLLDGSATFTAIQFFGFSEQHVVSNAIIQGFGPIAFLIVKFGLMLAILYFADKEIEDENLRGFIKIFIAIIGFAPGIRDVLLIGVGLGS
ncbi:MAG: DUF63 family protein [Candidatus Diapherotrites archaeon]|uniref:DUF63 family protein n=1 Tax=Candidatus Iainarchaeum sp. TaxID=3101447 RepID=A0A8T4L602_9ARCH|nr:DUF63 family protein [Candidatus Diapherotrites archaeon]